MHIYYNINTKIFYYSLLCIFLQYLLCICYVIEDMNIYISTKAISNTIYLNSISL